MRHVGFNHHWIDMVHICISLVQYSVLLNGTPTGLFHSSRGIRQEDPLSPYLFIMCMEILSRLITKKHDEGKLHGYKVKRSSPLISYLLFADNNFIFCKATLTEARELVDLLQQFTEITGQEVNYKKSPSYFSKNFPPAQENDSENHQPTRNETLW